MMMLKSLSPIVNLVKLSDLLGLFTVLNVVCALKCTITTVPGLALASDTETSDIS